MDRIFLDRISANTQGDMKLVEKLLRDGCEHKIGEELGWDKRKVQRIIKNLNEVYGSSNKIHSIRKTQDTNNDASFITYKMEVPQQLAFSEILLDSNDRNYMFSLYRLLTALGETIPTKDIIGFENNDGEDIFKGKIDAGKSNKQVKENIVNLYNPLMDECAICIDYYWRDRINFDTFTISPYCIKTFNNKWYLFGFKHGQTDENIHKWDIFDLNLIKNIREPDSAIEFKNLDLKEINRYYEPQIGFYPRILDIYGYPTLEDIENNIKTIKFRITKPNTGDKEKDNKVAKRNYEYIKNNPIHKSQQESKINHSDGEYEFTLHVVYSPNLFNILRFRGSEIEVLEPDWLREKMADEAQMMYNIYKNKN